MNFGLTLAAGLVLTAAPGDASAGPAPDTLWARGQTFDVFLEAAEGRRETWHRNWGWSEVAPDVLARARAVPGSWRFLVVALDACSDSVHTIPYLARLVAEVDGLDMRIVHPDLGREIMEAHPTPDGRAATPTVVLLDAEGSERGSWTERPAELQDWWIENPEGLDRDAKVERKFAWYDEDKGASTLREIVELLERAAGGGV